MRVLANDALLIVDPQNDFMPGGALAVPGGDQIFPAVNRLTRLFPLTVASQDWHPADHISFQEQGGPWPPHCVQNTPGSEFSPVLDQSRLALIVRKGFRSDQEEYSCFDQIAVVEMFASNPERRLFVTGVATEYCVLWSTLGALQTGLPVFVVSDAIREVGASPGDNEAAREKMAAAGAIFVAADDIKP